MAPHDSDGVEKIPFAAFIWVKMIPALQQLFKSATQLCFEGRPGWSCQDL